MSQSQINNQRIAKNTILLYIRTMFVMVVSLYTSRVILQVLGVEDYGVYQVVGGMVAMFAVISTALSAAISRYITFEIGTGNEERLKRIFSTSIVIQIVISVIVLGLAEIIGLWFVNTQMQIPDGRMTAAYWVLHCSLLTFVINLLSVPYNACIIAHEHMKAFAYVSIVEVMLKLGICFLITFSSIDRLISYSVLMAVVALLIRIIYTVYCHKHFEESRAKIVFDREIFKEMFGFAGWSFFTNTMSVFNNQGVNMLINVFFGVTFNAARGIANQVENAVVQFVNNFTVAVNPQITKSYAAGDKEGMYKLVCRGAKFSYYLMLMMALPLICEADKILHLWLTEIPPHAVILVQLSLILGMLDSIGSSGFTACMATGRLKKYALVISSIGILEFPLSWLAFKLGGAVEISYYLYIFVKAAVIIARMFLLRDMVGLPVMMYVKDVFVPILLTSIIAVIPSFLVIHIMPETFPRLLVSVVVGVSMAGFTAIYIGMDRHERAVVLDKAKSFSKKIKR